MHCASMSKSPAAPPSWSKTSPRTARRRYRPCSPTNRPPTTLPRSKNPRWPTRPGKCLSARTRFPPSYAERQRLACCPHRQGQFRRSTCSHVEHVAIRQSAADTWGAAKRRRKLLRKCPLPYPSLTACSLRQPRKRGAPLRYAPYRDDFRYARCSAGGMTAPEQ